jgi:hypothetical protein
MKRLLLFSGLILISCAHHNVEYLSVVDPYYGYPEPVYLPFELLLPKGTTASLDGPQGIDKNLQFSLWEGDSEVTRKEKLAFHLEIYHDRETHYKVEEYCIGQPNRGGRGVFEIKKVKKFENNYSVSTVEVPCLRYEIYLITNSDDSFIIKVFSDNSEWARDAIEYGVEHIRFLPENKTVKKEEEVRKQREGN